MMVPNLTSTGSGSGTPGPRGPRGYSDYELAQQEGYAGTLDEWLLSLKGDNGESIYEIAQRNGFSGTEADFIASLKGEPGAAIEMRKTETAIQWRLLGGDWADVVLLSDLVVDGGGGGGTIASVNGQLGPDVVLNAADVGAASAADLSGLGDLIEQLQTQLSDTNAAIGGKQTSSASLDAISAFSTAASLQSRTARLNFPTGGGGAVYAFGRNGRNNGGQMQGLQVGGGVEADGIHGVYMAPDGHGSWMRLQPSRNYSAIEEVIYATAAQGFAAKVSGTNTFTLTSGSPGDAANWVGEKFYWESEIYRVTGVSGTTVTVTTASGGAVSHTTSASGVFHLFWIEAAGTCTVSGSTITRVSGDPFLPFITDPSHHFTLAGVTKTVSAFTSTEVMTIASPPAAGTYAYRQRMDVDDTMTQLRLQKFFGDYEENLTLGAKPWGYFIRAQGLSASQGYRPLWLGSGENMSQLALMPNGSLRIGDHGKIRAPNTQTYNYLDVNGAPTTFAPNIRGRGPDANVGVGIDTQGAGEFVVTGNSFAKVLIKASTTGVGFNGAGPVAAPSLGAAATQSLSDLQRLLNAVRSCLIANGLATA